MKQNGMPPAEAARAAIRLVDVAGVTIERYAICVELLQNATPLVATPAPKRVTEVSEEATVVATAAGVAIGTGVLTIQGEVPWFTVGVLRTFTPRVGKGIGVGKAV